jgi:hypothetical protein
MHSCSVTLMPKGRHVGKAKKTSVVKETENSAAGPSFRSLEKVSPLLTLLYDSKEAQHAALSRIEAFYEGNQDAQTYLTLDEAQQERLCQHYEAFNFPIGTVTKWLQCMKDRQAPVEAIEEEAIDTKVAPWWTDYCNAHENHLLDHLTQLGVFTAVDESQDNPTTDTPIYLISTLSSKQAALQHERLHFLYYISAEYREKVHLEYQSLSTKSRKIIKNDLQMRKYSSSVWIDEFQAYISEDAGEFGKSIYAECQEIQSTLKPLQRRLWKDLNL